MSSENFLQNNSSENSAVTGFTEEQKIQQILQEQEKLQTLYNQVVVYIQEHPNISSEEMLKYQAQLKQLSEYYQKNQEKLKTLGYSNLQVNKNVVIKSGAQKSLSVKSIFIGCGAIIFFLVIGLIFLFYYLVQNPAQLSGLGSLGITPATAKDLLQGLTLTVMLIILLLGIIIIIMNVYKSFTVQNKPKTWYYIGIFVGVMILGLALGAGTKVLGEIGKIEVESLANPDEILATYAQTPTKTDPNLVTQVQRNHLLIAPVNMPFKLLLNNFQTYMKRELGTNLNNINTVQLDCGNGQILSYGQQNNFFNGACFYTKKGNYPVNLLVQYTDTQNQIQSTSYLIKTIPITSELIMQVPSDKKIEFSTNEIIIGALPVEMSFNADQIFRDLGLRNYRINWDGDGDGSADKTDDTNFVYEYSKAEVYYPSINLPDINATAIFSFPLRVEKSLTPVCSFDFQQKKVNDYTITASFYDGGERFIEDYSYLVIDHATNQVLDELHGKDMGMSFDYRFPGKGTYRFKMNFITDEGKKGNCEGEIKLTDQASYTLDYEVLLSTPRKTTFSKLDTKKIQETKIISLAEVPSKIKLKLTSITPKTYNTTVQMLFDGRPIVETTPNEYFFDVRDSKEHTITIKIEDKVRGLFYEEILTTEIGLDDIVGDLKVIGENSGFSPFIVTLDASATKLNDPNDEIAFFSRDFGDGTTQNNLSNAIIKHTYHFNLEKNKGTFTPQVTVTTKKGRSLSFKLPDPIVVNKQLIKLEISSPTHPTQESRVGERVVFNLDFNGLPKKIYRSFDENNQPLACDGRECIEMSKTFEEKGLYNIKVNIDFDDEQSVEQSILFKVR